MKEQHTTVIKSDEPVTIKIGGDHRWFRMFSSVIESGVWSKLSPSAAKVLVTIAKFADSCWVAFPGISTIQVSAGISRRAVYYALDELEGVGLLLRRRRGGGQYGSVYQLLPPIIENDLFNNKVQGVALGGARGCTKGVPVVAPELDQLTRPIAAGSFINSFSPSAAGSAAADISKFLISVGVGDPARSEIVSSGLTLEKIKKVVSKWRESGKGLGVLVLNLRIAAEQLPLEKQKIETNKNLRSSEDLLKSRVDAENQLLDEWYSALGSEREQELRQKASESLTSFERRLVGSKGPDESFVLLRAMYKLSNGVA